MMGIYGYSDFEIDNNAKRFYDEVNTMLKNKTSLNEWVGYLKSSTNKENAIDVFNRQCLYYD